MTTSIAYTISKTITLIASVLSCFTNSSIIRATFNSKLLQSSCHYFIAFGALCDFSAQFVHYIDAYLMFSGMETIEYYKCYLMIVVPFTMYTDSLLMTSIIGLDRLMSIAYPLMYRSINKFRYVGTVIGLSMCYNLIWTGLALDLMLKDPLKQIKCGFATFIYNSTLSDVKRYVNLFLCLIMVFVYATTWYLFKHSKVNHLTDKLLRPLTAIMIIILFSYPLAFGARVVALYIDPYNKLDLFHYISSMTNIGIAANYFVYYVFSKEYRQEFQYQLYFLPCFTKYFDSAPVNTVQAFQ